MNTGIGFAACAFILHNLPIEETEGSIPDIHVDNKLIVMQAGAIFQAVEIQ